MKTPRVRANVIALSLSLLFALSPLSAQPVDPHAAAIAQARAGDHAGALAALERLAAERPGDRAIVFDQIVVLGWAGRDGEALSKAATVDLSGAPAWLLEAIGHSARKLKYFDHAEAAWRRAMARAPERVDSRIGLAHTLADRGDHAAAAMLLDDALSGSAPGAVAPDAEARARLLDARASLAESTGDWIAALAFHQRALAAQPQRRDSLRGVIRSADRLGAPRLASDLAAELEGSHPDLLSDAQTVALADHAAALNVRWGRVEERIESGDARFGWLDRALLHSEPVATRLAEATGAGLAVDASAFDEPDRRRLADRIVALELRRRPQDAIALYESMQAAQLPVPAYALASVADSLVETRQPERALPLYQAALEASPDDFDASLGLFYALVEAERLDEATAHVDALAQRTPKWLSGDRANRDAVAARTSQALARLYADRLDEAERRTGELRDELPYNAQVREAFASVALARGRPRLADEEFRRALAVDSRSAGLRAQRVEPLLDVHAFAEAEAQWRDAAGLRADDHRVRRAGELWAVHNLRELEMMGSFGRSSGGAPTGTNDWRLDARLYSQPLAYRWRVFGQTSRSRADFDDGAASWHREGVGAEYRARDLRLTAALTDGSADRLGVEAGGEWQIDDRWSVAAFGSSVSSNSPLQAWKAGIRASEVALSARHAVSESRAFAAGLTQFGFTDGNDRLGGWASWFERWVSTPRWRFESTASLGASENSLDGAPYFNPGSDLTASVELAAEWLSWRRYERSFRHRLAATLGSYDQQDFGSGSIAGLAYEHVWDIDRLLYLRYGIGRSLRPYDGERTGRTSAFFMLNGRF